jgi:hypothetical protein
MIESDTYKLEDVHIKLFKAKTQRVPTGERRRFIGEGPTTNRYMEIEITLSNGTVFRIKPEVEIQRQWFERRRTPELVHTPVLAIDIENIPQQEETPPVKKTATKKSTKSRRA